MIAFGNLKKYIASRIDVVVLSDVFTNKSPANNFTNYIVITFPSSSFDNIIQENWMVQIDFWKKSDVDNVDSTDIQLDVENVKSCLNNSYDTQIDGFYRCYIEFESEIPDPDPSVYHYQQRYQVKVY